jgi:hypothetical protein
MSRISRYQESLSKFIKNKNIDEYFSEQFKEKIYEKMIDSDHLGGIIVSTLFNHNSKKSNFKGHGYFLAVAIDIILLILNSKTQFSNLNLNLVIGLYKLLTDNISIIKTNKADELNDIIIKIYEYFNKNIYDIITTEKIGETNKMNKSDLLNLKNINEQMYKKISNMNKYNQNDLVNFIKKTYGNTGKLIFVISWILGGGNLDKKILMKIEMIGELFGLLYKLSIDFDKVIDDINNLDFKDNPEKTSKNILINIGIQESFSLFMETKSKFYEESFKLEIYTHTMKEVIDEIETKIDKCLDNCKIDMKSMYSSFTK